MQQHDSLIKYIEEIKPGNWGSPHGSQLLQAVRCIRGADIPDINRWQTDNIPTRYIDKTKLERYLLRSGDIVIEKSGGSASQSTGRVAIMSREIVDVKPTVCSNFCAGLTFSQSVDHTFIYYYLSFIYKLGVFANYETKTNGIHNLMLKQVLSSIRTPQFDVAEQKSIATCLSLIDNKITKDKRDSQLLTDTINFIYNYWFVQFDFPDENGRPYKSSGGKMVYNEQLKQEIPAGWDVVTLSKIVSMRQPEQLSKATIKANPGQYLVYGSNGTIGRYNQYNYPSSVVAISCRGNCGNVYRTMPKSWITGNAMVIEPLDESQNIHNAFLKLMLESLDLKTVTTGSIQGQITRTNLGKVIALLPDKAILDSFNKIADAIYNIDISIESETSVLASLRDWLLPMLMNGQVEIKNDQ